MKEAIGSFASLSAAFAPVDPIHLGDPGLELYADRDGWVKKAILNIAGSGPFSSDRTIAEYTAKIWHAKPGPVP